MRCTLPSAALLATATLFCLLQTAPAAGQITAADLAGSWELTATAELPDDGGTCTYRGSVVIQVGPQGTLSGTPRLLKESGPLACPPAMMATLTGQVEGEQLLLGVMLGPLGEAELTAPLGPPPQDGGDALAHQVLTLQGSWSVTQGPFTGGGGTWAAAPASNVLAIPTLSWLGLGALVVLLLLVGAWILHRRRVAVI